MFSATKNPVSKLTVLVSATALLVGAAVALEWVDPEDEGVISDAMAEEYPLTVNSDSGPVAFSYREDSDDEWGELYDFESEDDNDWVYDWDLSDAGTGTYELRANETESEEDWEIIEVTVDNNNPELSLERPDEFTNDDEPEIEVEATDETSNIENITVSIEDGDGDEIDEKDCIDADSDSETCTIELGDGLDDGEYTIEATAFDEGYNSDSETWEFTVDTTIDFEVDPSFTPSPGIHKWEDGDSLTIEIADNSEDEGVNLECQDEDGDTIDSVEGITDTTTSCEIDDDYTDQEVNLTVEVCDMAGNCEEEGFFEFVFDASPPTVVSLEMPSGLVNDNFPVEFDAFDASGLDELEYFYNDDGLDTGDGAPVEINDTTDEFTASVAGLDAGEHTLYVRFRDNAGWWSEAETSEFTYDPDADPDLSFSTPENVSVEAGESTTFSVTVENTGDVFIPGTDISASADELFSDTYTIDELRPGNSTTAMFTVPTDEADVGGYDLVISAGDLVSEETTLAVRATGDQEERLESDLSGYEDRFELLEQNITRLEGVLSGERMERLESETSDFRNRIDGARDAKEDGEYYKISDYLENIEEDYQKASDALEDIEREHRIDRRNTFLMVGGGLTLLVIAGVGGFLYRSEDYDTGELLEGYDIDTGIIEDIEDRLKGLVDRAEEEAEEFEWDGFEN